MDNQDLLEEPKSITELFTFDLTTFFFEDDFEEIDCVEEQGVFMIEYKKNLPWLELDLFNSVIFRIFNDKTNIVGSSHINVSFPANPELQNSQTVNKLTNTLFKIYGWDDESMGEWVDRDSHEYENKTFRRIWTLGENKYIYTVKIIQNTTGEIALHIMFFNHLLKLTNKSISQSTNELGS